MQYTLFWDDNEPPARSRMTRNDVRTGDAAEALTKFKLLALDYDAHESRRDAAYDLTVDLHDGRVVRVQVKGCSRAVYGRWSYRFVRGNPRTGSGSYRYGPTDFDVTALRSSSIGAGDLRARRPSEPELQDGRLPASGLRCRELGERSHLLQSQSRLSDESGDDKTLD